MCYKCPNGHEVKANESEMPECYKCELVGTHWNAKTKEVYSWTAKEVHENNCRELQRQMDDAFDNQYFSDW
jgi:hypothetical protein